jgi:methylthioribose-1-phosphate isomerase
VNIIEAVRWAPGGDAVRIIDQRLLPERFEERDLRSVEEVCEAIRTLAVRGAPAIGVAGAMGLVVSLAPYARLGSEEFEARLGTIAAAIRGARPTAVNLPWAIDRMVRRSRSEAGPPAARLAAMREEAGAILDEDRRMCRRIGEHGVHLIPDGARVLTHCNAGALATGGIGTALAPLYLAFEAGRRLEVFVDETRPLMQGSRLTAWELSRAGIPVTLLADSMAASVMRAGRIDLCIVGADRIATNGDVANKIGTYGVAVSAHHHGIPMYVAAPASTFDRETATGDDIVIEQRDADELRRGPTGAIAPAEISVWNPAFDVTPASLVTAIISDRGVHRPPYAFGAMSERDDGAARTPVAR